MVIVNYNQLSQSAKDRLYDIGYREGNDGKAYDTRSGSYDSQKSGNNNPAPENPEQLKEIAITAEMTSKDLLETWKKSGSQDYKDLQNMAKISMEMQEQKKRREEAAKPVYNIAQQSFKDERTGVKVEGRAVTDERYQQSYDVNQLDQRDRTYRIYRMNNNNPATTNTPTTPTISAPEIRINRPINPQESMIPENRKTMLKPNEPPPPSQGILEAAPERKGWLGKWQREKEITSLEQLRTTDPVAKQTLGLKASGIAGALFFPNLAKSAVLHPIDFAIGLIYPVPAVKDVGERLLQGDPGIPGEIGPIIVAGGIFAESGRVMMKPAQATYLKFSKRGVPYAETGIQVIEDVSVRSPLEELRQFEGQKADTIHTTFSNEIGEGTILKAGAREKVGAFRQEIEQYNFFQSLPKEKPLAYGGYIGIDEGVSMSVADVTLFKPTAKALVFRDQPISPTPPEIISKGVKATVKHHTEVPGTYIAAENLLSMSTEHQVTTSVGTEANPIFQLEANKAGPLADKFTYYNQKKPVPSILGTSAGKQLLAEMAKNPSKFLGDRKPSIPKVSNPEISMIMKDLNGENVAVTGGLARKIFTGKGAVRDLDIVSVGNEGRALAEKVQKAHPDKFEIIQHEKIPEIFRIKSKASGKVVADFDPLSMAEEGLLRKDSFTQIEGVKVVKSKVLLKSKALQIQKGKITAGGKQFKNIEQLTGVSEEALKSTESTAHPVVQKVWDALTSKNTRIEFKELKLKQLKEARTEVGGVKKPSKIVDLAEYNKSYEPTRKVSAGELLLRSPKFSVIRSRGLSAGMASEASKVLSDTFKSSPSKSKGSLSSAFSSPSSGSMGSRLSISSGSSVPSIESSFSAGSRGSSGSGGSRGSGGSGSSGSRGSRGSSPVRSIPGSKAGPGQKSPRVISHPSPPKSGDKVEGYNVYMKEYGKMVKANKKPLPRDEAERTGRFIADQTVSASFHLSKIDHKVPAATRAEKFIGEASPYKFQSSNKRPNWTNEKRTFRIDTPGEKAGLRVAKFLKQNRKVRL